MGRSETRGECSLRIEVHKQHPLTFFLKGGTEVQYGCCFANASLLIGHGDNASHIVKLD